ncbi:uncharacterized protein LOC123550341 [Mercenaria mercenaria]|uniref:uncharacterized protein LOC123550341 n=1 Tax=Mercenaria mercenaria TaxID=6596 RepID=UPI00234E63FB|nr:uncharacterized protein LOC123550341 [Mercenaria mercenaria]XP_045194723.2 uncharacterized protein LOC123550341 [Mercenaria mercenaria]XP_045194729.2 uncharacterized protein LOC123550341 [Mercenaria mercenaria]
MADPRLQPQQQFHLIRCKLCNNIYESPRILDCLHSFCTGCLQSHISQPSQEDVKCPVCQEPTKLPIDGVHGLMLNTLLVRFINQAQKDKTTVVAGREVLQMTQEALTESELKCPEVVAGIQDIASTAGHVLADNLEDNSMVNDLESMKARQSVQQKMTQLQVKAMAIVHSIDKVNQAHKDWENRRAAIRNAVKHRSLEIQDSVRCIERRLIAQLEDRDIQSEKKNKAFTVKNELHKILRTSLGLVDFLRLVSEFGDLEELEKYSCLATAREEKLYSERVLMTENDYTFETPKVDTEEGLEMMFGCLSEITEETVAWDPHRLTLPSHPRDNAMPESAVRYPRTGPSLTSKYTEVDENVEYGEEINEDTSTVMSNRFAKRQFSSNQVKGHHRHPMKSMSFDAAMPSSPYNYIRSENQDLQQQMLHAQEPDVHPRFQILNEHETDNDSGQTKVKGHDSVQSAMQSLETSSKITAPGGYRSMGRRVSAPPSLLIDTLNRRRLNALSILERANINTEGLNVTSDIESGMNEARLEWLRESLRKKAERSTSQDEGV